MASWFRRESKRKELPDPVHESPATPIEELVRRMILAGQLTGAPAEEADISAAEKALGVHFPHDYRTFLSAAGGKSPEKLWRSLWNVGDLVSLNRELPLFKWFPGIIGIGNEGFFVTAFDYRRGGPPWVVSLGLSISEESEIDKQADSFAEWLESTL